MFEYYNNFYCSEDIAKALCYYAVEDEETIDDVKKALDALKAICENKYNSDYYRTLWKVLQRLTDYYESESDRCMRTKEEFNAKYS